MATAAPRSCRQVRTPAPAQCRLETGPGIWGPCSGWSLTIRGTEAPRLPDVSVFVERMGEEGCREGHPAQVPVSDQAKDPRRWERRGARDPQTLPQSGVLTPPHQVSPVTALESEARGRSAMEPLAPCALPNCPPSTPGASLTHLPGVQSNTRLPAHHRSQASCLQGCWDIRAGQSPVRPALQPRATEPTEPHGPHEGRCGLGRALSQAVPKGPCDLVAR